MNLIINTFIFIIDKEALANKYNINTINSRIQLLSLVDIANQRKKEFLGKVYNFTITIYRSPQLVIKQNKLITTLIPRENATRWNSQERLFAAYLYPRIQYAYKRQQQKYLTELPVTNKFTDKDQLNIEKFQFFLKALVNVTKFTEGLNATIKRVLLTMEFILEYFENGKVSLTTYSI